MDVGPVETIEGEAAFATDFADREPIEGGLTIVDLTASTCRWPSGNPRDLKTFRYCGETAHSGPTASAMRISPICREPRDLAVCGGDVR
jgi:hypothetical protein